ncbi:DUF5107 domain-containing protein [Microbacterium sp. APC 3901]|uniref:DUF5107 domain-containing protein n=1 Tax=Microbacterium sp. APC 3901 TaxID=3035192 RepID=UPI0025B3E111|nr:DUF5107 domain-containing protein [Microbacterium sp. APC 3901]MDN3445441.1 DUF5107 domain-containing protein [Microbacterium sp. APC 3901]
MTVDLPAVPQSLRGTLDDGRPVAWREPLTIATYEAGAPSPYPMFLDHRVYQGSSGAVYPIPFIESVDHEASPREWDAIHLENEYVRLVVLPELGGRIHVGYDKVTGYDFFYRNNVIKPALVGLAGPWISGGVEFNWPQHHRPATHLPVETRIDTDADGTVTVWCHDHDPFARMSAQHGVRLRPGSSVVELAVRLHNRTKERQSFLWWANVAARVHDDYQAFFPEDVRFVADHARRALTSFPAADRPYYGVDYPLRAAETPGADRIDWYRNIPVPTSYMIVDSHQDFFGGYDHAAGAGFVHWAEHRVSPGKKMWTWGDAPFGHAWDAQLTDADGPYVELMAGVYTDNQPDFSWLLPGETKTFTQYWYPVPAIGAVHQATPDAAVHIDREGEDLVVSVAATACRRGARVLVLSAGETIGSHPVDLDPGVPAVVRTRGRVLDDDLEVRVLDADGRVLVRWAPVVVASAEPWVAEEPPAPDATESVEELYLTGLHLSQYRHPTRSPMPYWRTALQRDPGDVRTNLAVADRLYRQGRYEEALAHVRTAVARLTRRNANPADAEAFYLLGLVHSRLGHVVEAQQAFGKAGWDGAWSAAAGFALAQSLAHQGQDRSAMRVLDELDAVAAHDQRRIALRAILLRRSGRDGEAQQVLDDALRADPLAATIRFLAGHAIGDAGILLDVALELRDAGDTASALLLLDRVQSAAVTPSGNLGPIAHYLAAGIHDAEGRPAEAAAHRRSARRADLTWAFPAGLDALDALTLAVAAEPDDATARMLRGALLYASGRRVDAASEWNAAIELGLRHPVLLRDAALAAYSVAHDDDRAWTLYRQAVEAAPGDARLRYEQDQLAVRLGHDAASRYERLRSIETLVLTRDDFAIAYVRLLLTVGETTRAYAILTEREFRPWEGGEGEALAAWDATLAALDLPMADPPPSLGEARSPFTPPAARHDSGETDYFATSLPELLLFTRGTDDD